MADKIVAAFAAERNLAVQKDTAFYSADGYTFSVANYPSLQRWGVSVPVEESGWNKDVQKELKRILKEQKLGALVYIKGIVMVGAPGVNQKKRFENIDKIIAVLMRELPRLGLRPRVGCHICGAADCNDYIIEGKTVFPIHTPCKEEKAARILAEVQVNRQSGSMLLGLIGAIVGGIIGALPSLIVIMLLDRISVYLFILIPAASYFGYKKVNGVLNAFVPFLISIVSLICTIALVVTSFLIEGTKIWPGRPLSVVWRQIMINAQGAFIESLLKSLLFCIIGIVIAWSYIGKSNKHRIKEAEEILQSTSSRMNP